MLNAFRIAGNNIRQLLKKPSNILVYILLPPILAVVFMMMISSGQSSSISIGISDNDKTASSAELIRYIEENDKYEVVIYEKENLEKAVAGKVVRAGIDIPTGFGEYLSTGGDIKIVEVMSIEGAAVTAWLKGFMEQKISTMYLAGQMLLNTGKYDEVITGYSNKYIKVEAIEVIDESRKMEGTSAGFGMYTFASLFGIFSICALTFKEKVNKTYQRIMSGPVSPWQYSIGNTMACMFFAALHSIISLTLIYNIFGIGTLLNLWQFIVLITVFYLSVIPMGLFLMSLGKSYAAVLAVNVLVLTLTCMLGGCYWDVTFMPDIMQKMAMGTTQYWFTTGIKGLMNEGNLSSISTNLIILAVFGVVFTLAYILVDRLKKNRMSV
ncbi:MAG: ABC transporter permease [Clostridia bacterium]|nr:ABC transporter permease [Clostridia bacterium]